MIYHITSRSRWAQAQAAGLYRAPSLESEGFIHCSRLDQVLDVANNFYRDQSDLLLLCIEEGELESELRWEAPAHPKPITAGAIAATARFPHLYGPLKVGAVTAVMALEATADGDTFTLPSGLP